VVTPSAPKAGRALDRRVAREIFGVAEPERVPRYSTEEEAADLVLLRLQSPALRCAIERFDGRWLVVWWGKISGKSIDKSERLSTSTARTRALAICRSALNLPASRRLSPAPKRREKKV
jgi:hypothetical protein